MREIVLSYPKLNERIESRENPKSERAKAIKNLDEMRADFSEAYIKTLEKLLDASLPKLYDGINFETHGVDFAQLCKDSCVVVVPNHQSHADYLAINYVVYKKFRFPLYVAGGNNLNIFPLGTLFRKSGCFFIRRSFANDATYKLTMEAYLYYLLKEGKPVEFFFEGGRTRTGKLLSPRFGLYHMLLNAHSALIKAGDERPLTFVPVSIAHEYVPEQKSLVKEMGGGKKKKESTGQLLGLLKLFAYQFGSVHINLGKPINAPGLKEREADLKEATHKTAFKCFREVGNNMVVTPTSLLALVLLDEPSGALIWNDILSKARAVIDYCEKFEVPYVDSLKSRKFEKTLERAVDILIGNKKIDVMGRGTQGHKFYTIKDECRGELLYFKNSILHHFLIPSIINTAWISLFNGSTQNVNDLKKIFLEQRNQLKHEFYLPTVKQFFYKTLTIVSDGVGRRITNLDDCMKLTQQELYSLVSKIGVFSRVLSYINEAYYSSALAIKELNNEKGFRTESHIKRAQEIFDEEKNIGRVIKYPESFSPPLCRSSLKYFTHKNLIENDGGSFKITNETKFDKIIIKYHKDLEDRLRFNIRVQ